MQYFCCDTETGGLDPQKNSLLSVAIILLDDKLNEISRHYTLVNDNPDRVIEEQAIKVNGLDIDEIRQKGRNIDFVINRIKELTNDKVAIAHNGSFDFSFLNYRGLNIVECIDTMLLSRKKWVGQPAKLGAVVERMGFSVEGAHNSLMDAIMTVKILKEFSKDETLHALEPKPIIFDRFKKR